MIKKSRANVLWIKLCGQVRGAWAVPSLWSGPGGGAVPSLWSGLGGGAVPSLWSGGAWAVPSLWSGEEPGAVPSLWSGERDEAVPSLGEWVQLRGPHLITPGPEQPSPFLPQSEGNC